jgi:hypothetical protein
MRLRGEAANSRRTGFSNKVGVRLRAEPADGLHQLHVRERLKEMRFVPEFALLFAQFFPANPFATTANHARAPLT